MLPGFGIPSLLDALRRGEGGCDQHAGFAGTAPFPETSGFASHTGAGYSGPPNSVPELNQRPLQSWTADIGPSGKGSSCETHISVPQNAPPPRELAPLPAPSSPHLQSRDRSELFCWLLMSSSVLALFWVGSPPQKGKSPNAETLILSPRIRVNQMETSVYDAFEQTFYSLLYLIETNVSI